MSSPTTNWSAEREAGFLAAALIGAGAQAPLDVGVMAKALSDAYAAGRDRAALECEERASQYRRILLKPDSESHRIATEVLLQEAESCARDICVLDVP